LSGTDGGLIEYCIAFRNGELNSHKGGGPVGIWTWEADSVIIQHCISYNNSDGNNTGNDGGGFDIDGGCTNSIIQYCYSYNNVGPGFEFAQFNYAHTFKNNTIRWCVSQNDGNGADKQPGISVWSGSTGAGGIISAYVYGNTVYSDNTAFSLISDKNYVTDLFVYNNIFVTKSSSPIVKGLDVQSGIFKNNLLWSTSRTFTAQWNNQMYSTQSSFENAAHWVKDIFSDPALADLGNGPEIKDPKLIPTITQYTPKPNSPVIDAGDVLSNEGFYPGPTDFLGQPLPTDKYDIGAVFHK